jgi:phage baseplate assembly protein V
MADQALEETSDLVGIIQAVVRDELSTRRVAEIGVVTEVFPHASGGDKNNYACTVRLRDSGLELPKVAVATGRIGLAAIPNVDDLVLVTFVGGDLHDAVITGRLYDDVSRPPEAKARECVYVSPDDAESGLRRVYLEFPNGNTLLVDDDKVVLKAGDTKLTINNGGDVELASAAKVVVKSTGATQVQSQGDISLQASGSMTLKAGTDVKIEGLSVSVKGQTTAQVEGGASTTIKGPLISLAGMTNFSPG